jgi:signal transduction histidine kinase
MFKRSLNQKKWGLLFLALHLLLLSQVLWWVIVFCRDVDLVKNLRTQNLFFSEKLGIVAETSLGIIEKEARHQKIMFLSESSFFALVASLALWLLFKGLKREEKTLKAQRNFIEVISHESKTPLTALKLRLESIKEKFAENSISIDIDRALEEVRRLSRILEKALELNRMERYSLAQEPVDIGHLISDLLRRMEPLLRERKILINCNLEEGLTVRGDSYGLQNSLQSLIENAVQYNDSAEKKVTVGLTRCDAEVVLSVQDNGPGVPKKEEALIFDRFYRGRSGKKVPGTGLGLYLAQQIIQAHQGVLRLVRSKEGAHFEIKLPLVLEAI